MGYLMIPLASWPDEPDRDGSWIVLIVYLLAYALMNAGAFALVAALYRDDDAPSRIDDLAGWGYRVPGLAAAFALCMLSLGGIPPTLGFTAKYLVFVEAVRSGHLWLALVGVATSLVAVFYYLRVVYLLYMKSPVAEPTLAIGGASRLAAAQSAGGHLLLGLFPGWVLDVVGRLVE
jgi:NADH-quinone oxidoreductase subunit N